jgi:hypothetical protein
MYVRTSGIGEDFFVGLIMTVSTVQMTCIIIGEFFSIFNYFEQKEKNPFISKIDLCQSSMTIGSFYYRKIAHVSNGIPT